MQAPSRITRRDAPAFNVLLLTATVRPPPDARSLARNDPQQRLADYLCAFEFYLDALQRGAIDAIVLAENSGFDLSCFDAMARRRGLQDRFEGLSHHGLDYPGRYGRGFGEFKLVDHAMAHSRTIASAAEGLVVWKVTGRYMVRNLEVLVASRPAHADLYCHSHNWPRPYVDLYVLAWTRAGHRAVVRGAYEALRQDNTPLSAEKRFRRHLDGRGLEARVVRRFGCIPRVDGVRAGDNRSFSQLRARYLLRTWALRWLPRVWI